MKNYVFITLALLCSISLVASCQDEKIQAGSILIMDYSIGSQQIGENSFICTASNNGDSDALLYLSLRVEGTSYNYQRSYYYKLTPGETREISELYTVPSRNYQTLKVYFGIPDSLPEDLEEGTYPNIETTFLATHALEGPINATKRALDKFNFWLADDAGPDPGKTEDTDEIKAARDRLRKLFTLDRAAAGSFSPVIEQAESRANAKIEKIAINGEKDIPINFLMMRSGNYPAPPRVIIGLSGNPPGTGKSLINTMMPFIQSGYAAVMIDRRPSARKTDQDDDFLADRSDPIFDIFRVIEYLKTRDDIRTDSFAMFGFSLGASEAQYALALHPDVSVGMMMCFPIDFNYQFDTWAWLPCYYNQLILKRIGLGDQLGDFDAIYSALDDRRLNKRAQQEYMLEYPWFPLINSTHLLSLAAPKPMFIYSGALDDQFPVQGVISLLSQLREKYNTVGAQDRVKSYIATDAGHRITRQGLDLCVNFLRLYYPPAQ